MGLLGIEPRNSAAIILLYVPDKKTMEGLLPPTTAP
jgi:hypothetical protein